MNPAAHEPAVGKAPSIVALGDTLMGGALQGGTGVAGGGAAVVGVVGGDAADGTAGLGGAPVVVGALDITINPKFARQKGAESQANWT